MWLAEWAAKDLDLVFSFTRDCPNFTDGDLDMHALVSTQPRSRTSPCTFCSGLRPTTLSCQQPSQLSAVQIQDFPSLRVETRKAGRLGEASRAASTPGGWLTRRAFSILFAMHVDCPQSWSLLSTSTAKLPMVIMSPRTRTIGGSHRCM